MTADYCVAGDHLARGERLIAATSAPCFSRWRIDMEQLRFTLLSDGSSDRGLIPVLDWTLRQHLPGVALQHGWADFRRLPQPPRSLSARVNTALSLYPCDVLFVHRDAETDSRTKRLEEIECGFSDSSNAEFAHIPVIPVRMTEAWLLISEPAIRVAAGNPNGDVRLQLPDLRMLEDVPDPKEVLFNLLKEASQLAGRRLRKFHVTKSAADVAGRIDDFSPLRQLRAYREFESDVTAFANRYLTRN